MMVDMCILALFAGVAGARAVKRQQPEGELFISLNGKSAEIVSQCDELGVTFGGGTPPYTFGIWAEDQQAVISEANMDAGGAAIWSIQSSATNVSLRLGDSVGGSVKSQSVVVSPGTESCYDSVPVLRMGDQPGNTEPSNSVLGSLEDCRQNGPATCKFKANGQSGVYSQQVLMGNIFANCHSTESVKQTFTGSTTITDNWSVGASAVFGPPLGHLKVSTEISQEESRTVTQSFEWVIKPGQQTALVAIGQFNGIYGGMDMSYSNGSRARITNAIYFQSTREKATVTRLDINCGENWPTWNATTETNGSVMRGYSSYGLGVLALVISIVVLC
ncbi:hypothetical protein ACGC1H_000344 [Rhizoctonia solani]